MTGRNWKRINKVAAFTLIELLIVLVIIGIITATTLFSVGSGGQKRHIEAAAYALQDALSLAQARAILTTQVIGFHVDAHNYAFYVFSKELDRDSRRLNATWIPIKDNTLLSKQTVPHSILFSISFADTPLTKWQNYSGKKTDDLPQILILPSGGFTPFTLIVSDTKKQNGYVIKGDMAGNLSLDFFPNAKVKK